MTTPFKTSSIIQEAKDLSKYGKEFQLKLLSLLIQDRTFSFSILPIIKDIYFSDIYLKTIFTCIKEYIGQYHTTPTFDNVKIILQVRGEKIAVYEKLIEDISAVNLEDRDFVIENARSFCFTKHALSENEKMITLLKEGKFEEAKKIAIEAFQHTGLDSARVFDLKKDYKKIYEHDALRAPVPNIFQTFNDNSKGGPGAGDICIVIAPSNFGKSNYLSALARHANFVGKSVLYFTYEETAEAITEKYLAGLMDSKRNELKLLKKETEEKINDYDLGNLKIIEDKGSKATIANMKSQLDYVKSLGFFPELICVDGLNQLKLPHGVRAKDDNEKYEILTEELKELFKEEGVAGYASWQTNRSGFASELNGIESIGKAVEVFQKADQVITFSQSPEMKDSNECIAYLLKNRLGQKEIALRVYYDTNKVLFIEKEVINARVLLSDNQKKRVSATVSNVREKIKVGDYLKKD